MDKLVSYFESRNISGSSREKLLCYADLLGRDFFVELLSELEPSGNTLKNILGLVSEIARRDGQSLPEVLTDEHIDKLRLDANLSRKRKQQLILSRLKRMRYPERAKVEDKLHQLSRKLGGLYKCKIELPKELEGDAVHLTLKVRSPSELSSDLSALGKMTSDPDLESLFEILQGKDLDGGDFE